MAQIDLDKLKELILEGKTKSDCAKALTCSLQAVATAHQRLQEKDDKVYKFKAKTALKDEVVVGKNGALTIAKSRIPNLSYKDKFKVKVDGNKITLTKI